MNFHIEIDARREFGVLDNLKIKQVCQKSAEKMRRGSFKIGYPPQLGCLPSELYAGPQYLIC